MGIGDNVTFTSGQTHYDLVIVGAGICGCWTAYKAGQAGLKTLLLEAANIGAGASGGLLGALMPHMPERWDGKKQFQFEALHALPQEIEKLETQTGAPCGYVQCGRIAPIMNATKRGQMLGHGEDVDKYWLGIYKWNILDETPVPNWPISSRATHGVVHDTLSARISPRGLLSALRNAIETDNNVCLSEHMSMQSFDEKRNCATLSDGTDVLFSHLVLSAGVNTFDFIAPRLSVATRALGKPIKGQAAMLKADVDPNLPIMFDDGLYVIAHDHGRVAIGSTSELEFSRPDTTDDQIEKLISKARHFCPDLKNAEVLERWAGLRPRAVGRDPLIDLLPGTNNVIISTSGFKITFGVAHKMADVAIEYVLNKRKTPVPESFKFSSHLAKARRVQLNDAEFQIK